MRYMRLWFVVLVAVAALCGMSFEPEPPPVKYMPDLWVGNVLVSAPSYVPLPDPQPWVSLIDQATGRFHARMQEPVGPGDIQ